MPNSGLAFVASHISVKGDLPVEILPGHVFRRARPSEIEHIRKHLDDAGGGHGLRGEWLAYDHAVKKEPLESANGHKFSLEPLPEGEWKYWVLAFEGNSLQTIGLELAALLLPVEIEFALVLLFNEPDQSGGIFGWQTVPLHIVEKYTGALVFEDCREVSTDDLRSIALLWQQYNAIPQEHAFVKSAVDTYSLLRRVPQSTPLYAVGLFSIIESLITHAPRLTETLDSINHQITNKIVLLRKMYSRPIDPAEYFLPLAEDKVWKKLYAYRSAVAHGSAVDFASELKVLKDHNTVVEFLRDNVKELIKVALRSPEFVSDLRRC